MNSAHLPATTAAPMYPIPPRWPTALNAVLDRLEHGRHQEFRETVMNAGNVRRRPIGTGAPMLYGEVSLTGSEWALIAGCNGALFELPDGTVRALHIGRHAISHTGNVVTGVTLDLRLIQRLSVDMLIAAKDEIQRRQGGGIPVSS